MIRFLNRALAIVLAAVVAPCSPAALLELVRPMPSAHEARPLAYPVRTSRAPAIDGALDDPCWTEAARLEPFRNNETRAPALEPATAFVCYDDQALYIAVEAVEQQMNHLGGSEQGDREDVWSGDEMEFFIAPHGDGKTYYQFAVGALHGQRYDMRSDLGTSYHHEGWVSAVHLDKEGRRWITEVKIPFAAFGMEGPPPQGTLWGFNLGRQNVHTREPDLNWEGADEDHSIELSQWSPTGMSFQNVAKFGQLYFGTPETFTRRREPLHVDLVLDRYAYDNLDGDAQGIVTVRPGGRALGELSVRLSLKKGDKVVSEQTLGDLGERATAFLLPVKDLEPGHDYTLEARVTSGEAEPAEATWTFDRADEGLAEGVAIRGRIPLKLPARDENKSAFPWPVRTGVPFPKGALGDPARTRLLVNGRPAPCQATIRARWSPRGPVRWLGLTFIAHDPTATYELEYGVDPGPAPAPALTVEQAEGSIAVNTGPLRFQIDTRSYNGIAAAWVDRNRDGRFDEGEQAVAATEAASPYIVDDQGVVYRTSGSDEVSVEVEEAGPLHAVVRARGWFASDAGGKLCRFTTYYEAFAGLPHVFVNHAVVITYDTKSKKLRDIGFPLAVSGGRYAIGTENGKALEGDRGPRVFALQDRWDHYTVQAGGAQEGSALAGWADAGDADRGVTISGQYLPERFPRQFTIDADHLTYHLWPPDLGDTFSDDEELARHNIYKLLSAHEGPELDLQMPQNYFDKVREYATKEQFYLIYAKQGIESNGQGVAVNEPFVITFRDEPVDAPEASGFAQLFEQDPHAIADPAWIEKSGVFGPIAAIDRDRYPQVARFVEGAFLAMAWPPIRENHEYGMFNFGDVHTYWYWWNDPPQAGIHRVWLSHHYGQTDLPWLLYAHSGDPRHLQWARVNNHHTMNIDIVHHEDPGNPINYHRLGAVYHVKGFVHWGGDSSHAAHLAYTNYLHWAWVMTGNRRARDVADEWVQGVVAAAPTGYQGRDGQTFLGEVTNYYQNRWDPRLLRLMENFARSMLAEPLEKQHAAYWNPATWYRYYGLRRDPVSLERINAPAYRAQQKARHMSAYLSLLTGDRAYLDELDSIYEDLRVQYDNPEDPYDGLSTQSFYDTGTFVHQLLVIQKAFAEAGELIRPDLKRPRPQVVETGPYTRSSPQQYTLGVEKPQGRAVTIDTGQDQDLAAAVTITGPGGNPVDSIVAEASPGLYVVSVKAPKLIAVKGAEPFFLVKAGQEYGLLDDTIATIAPLEGNGPTVLQFRAGDKHPVRLTVIDARGDEVVAGSSWYRREHTMKSLTIPAGGPYRIVAPYPTTIVADRDLKLLLHTGEAAPP